MDLVDESLNRPRQYCLTSSLGIPRNRAQRWFALAAFGERPAAFAQSGSRYPQWINNPPSRRSNGQSVAVIGQLVLCGSEGVGASWVPRRSRSPRADYVKSAESRGWGCRVRRDGKRDVRATPAAASS